MPVAARVRELARDTFAHLRGHDLMLLSAGLTFYAAIAVVPLLLIAVYLAGLVLGADTVAQRSDDVAAYVPERLGIRDGLRALVAAGPRLGLASVLAALIPATTYGEGLARALARVANRPPRRAPGIWGRVRALSLLAVLPLIVVLGLVAVAILPGVLGPGQGARLLGAYLTFWGAWVSSALLLGVVYRTFGGPLRLRSVLWGALSAGSFLAGMSMGWVLFLRFDVTVGRAYGGSELLGGVVLAVLYLFLVQVVVLVGHALTLALDARDGDPPRHDRGG